MRGDGAGSASGEARLGGTERAEGPLATSEIGDRGAEVGRNEIGPHLVEEAKLGLGTFPQQEIGEPLLASRADEEVDIRAGIEALPWRGAGLKARGT